MSRNSLVALDCIVSIENGFDKVDVQPPIVMAKKIGWGAMSYEFRFPNPATKEPVTFRLLYMAVWERFNPRKTGWYDQQLSTQVERANNAQLLIAFNIGMHEKGEQDYTHNLKRMFSFAKSTLLKMGNNPSRNKFLYRETTAQHYNLSAGYYDYYAMKRWRSEVGQRLVYRCVPSASTDSAKHDWRYHAETEALSSSDMEHVQFVPFHEVSRHYHDMHPFAFKRTRVKRKVDSNMDCTHYQPDATVILHRILWHSLLIH